MNGRVGVRASLPAPLTRSVDPTTRKPPLRSDDASRAVQLVADVLVEVDDDVATEHEVVGLAWYGIASRSPRSKAITLRSSAFACQPSSPCLEPALERSRGAVRTSSWRTARPRARQHSRVDVGAPSPPPWPVRAQADGGDRVTLGAVGATGAPHADPARLGELGTTSAPSAAHCSGLRHSCDTLIVTRSGSARARSASGAAREVLGQRRMPSRREKLRSRRSICPRLYWSRSRLARSRPFAEQT